jgi:hypothetical protein
LLAALGREARLLDAKLMIAHYMDFTVAYALILQSHTPKLKISASTLKHCYIALKTWLLLIDHLRETCHPEDVDEYDSLQMKIWTQLWPPLDRTSTFIVTYNDGSPLERSVSPMSACPAIRIDCDLSCYWSSNLRGPTC